MMPFPMVDKGGNPLVAGTKSMEAKEKDKLKEKAKEMEKAEKEKEKARKKSSAKSSKDELKPGLFNKLFSGSKIAVNKSQTEQSASASQYSSDNGSFGYGQNQPAYPSGQDPAEQYNNDYVAMLNSKKFRQAQSPRDLEDEHGNDYADFDPMTGLRMQYDNGQLSESTRHRHRQVADAAGRLDGSIPPGSKRLSDTCSSIIPSKHRDYPTTYVPPGGSRPNVAKPSSPPQAYGTFAPSKLGQSFGSESSSDPFAEVPKSHVIKLNQLSEIDDIVEAAVLNNHPILKAQWNTYMNDYQQGRYNISNPATAPRAHSTLLYLPAVYPPDEKARTHCLAMIHPNWSSEQVQAGKRLCDMARDEFGIGGACLSLISGHLELLKVEIGYNTDGATVGTMIPRAVSIAAHVVLTHDVMYILDTKKDWRFKGNPLVTGPPAIRFVAAAPVMTCKGTVLGVFYIFSKYPRDAFPPIQARRLADMATMAMTNVIEPFRMHMPEEVEELKKAARVSESSGRDKVNDWRQGMSDRQSAQSRGSRNTHQSGGTQGDDEAKRVFDQRRIAGFGKNTNNLALEMDNVDAAPRTGDSDGLTPRPFTGSDLTSVESRQKHLNTPAEAAFSSPDLPRMTRRSPSPDSDMMDDDDSSFMRGLAECDQDLSELPAAYERSPAAYARSPDYYGPRDDARAPNQGSNMDDGRDDDYLRSPTAVYSSNSGGNGNALPKQRMPPPRAAPAPPKKHSLESVESQKTFETTRQKSGSTESAHTSVSTGAVLEITAKTNAAMTNAARIHGFDAIYIIELPPPSREDRVNWNLVGAYGFDNIRKSLRVEPHLQFLGTNLPYSCVNNRNPNIGLLGTFFMVRIAAKPYPGHTSVIGTCHYGLMFCAARLSFDGSEVKPITHEEQLEMFKCAEYCKTVMRNDTTAVPPSKPAEPPARVNRQSMMFTYTNSGVFHPTESMDKISSGKKTAPEPGQSSRGGKMDQAPRSFADGKQMAPEPSQVPDRKKMGPAPSRIPRSNAPAQRSVTDNPMSRRQQDASQDSVRQLSEAFKSLSNSDKEKGQKEWTDYGYKDL